MPRGAITFVFDDGYESVYQNVLPILKQHNFPAVFALPLDATSLFAEVKRPLIPWPDWMDLKNQGHEIAAHSATHTDLTLLSPEELEQELSLPVKELGATTLVYPGGAYNEQVVEAASKHYQTARTVERGIENLIPQNLMQLKTFNFSRRNFSVFKANLLALRAYLTNSWLIETYHIVDNNEKNLVHTVSTDDFAKHLRFVAKLGINVITIKQALK